MKRRSDVTSVTFKGNLEVSDTHIPEYNKEIYQTALMEKVGFYGLHSLFSMPPDTSMKMKSLVEDTHLFSLSSVRNEYGTRMVRSITIFELDSTTNLTTKSNSESIRSRNKGLRRI